MIFTDAIPHKRKREAIEKAIKISIHELLSSRHSYRLFHHESKSNFDLQIVDYLNWAIYRKWTNKQERFYEMIQPHIASEFEIFKDGEACFY